MVTVEMPLAEVEVLVGQGPRAIEEHAGIRVDACFEDADQRPAREPDRSEVFLHLETED